MCGNYQLHLCSSVPTVVPVHPGDFSAVGPLHGDPLAVSVSLSDTAEGDNSIIPGLECSDRVCPLPYHRSEREKNVKPSGRFGDGSIQ